MITDKQLQGMCAQVANMAKTELRHRHKLNGILAVYFEGSGLRRLRKLEMDIEKHAGEAWLSSAQAKDIVFGTLCGAAGEIPPDAIVVSTGVDKFEPTAAFLALPPGEQERIAQLYPRDVPEYFQPYDALMSLAQTAERVCCCYQRMQVPGFLLIGEPETVFWPQSKFGGRLKFYGIEPPPGVRMAIERLRRRADVAAFEEE